MPAPGRETIERDPENRLYSRFDMKRLEAEAVRDALMAVGGRLDRRLGGTLLSLDETVTPQLLSAVCSWVHPDTGDRFASALPAGAEGHA